MNITDDKNAAVTLRDDDGRYFSRTDGGVARRGSMLWHQHHVQYLCSVHCTPLIYKAVRPGYKAPKG